MINIPIKDIISFSIYIFGNFWRLVAHPNSITARTLRRYRVVCQEHPENHSGYYKTNDIVLYLGQTVDFDNSFLN